MAISRRSFFGKVAGAALGAYIAPFVSASLLGANGAQVGGGVGAFGQGTLAMLHGPEYVIPLVRATDELLRDSAVDFGELVRKRLAATSGLMPSRSLHDVMRRQGL